MKKAIRFLFIFQFLILTSAIAQTPKITNGLNYLTSAQQYRDVVTNND